MIVGCYTLDLYCDVTDGERWPGEHFQASHMQFTHELGTHCRMLARRAGWQFGAGHELTRCPKHNTRRNNA